MKSGGKKTILVGLFALLSLAGCGSDTEGTEPLPLIGSKPYDIGSCTSKPESGNKMTDFDDPTPVSDSGYFSKPFLFEPFEEALTSSSLSIAQVLQREGVQLYQVMVNPSATCRYFDFLFEAPQQQIKSWESVTFSGGQAASLLGLFTTIYNKDPEIKNVYITKPVIMLRSDTQKWTLIHEMSHYLFARSRIVENDMPFNKDLEKQINESKNQINKLEESFDKKPNRGLARQLVAAHTRLFDLTIRLDGRGPLEEFSIEAMLSERVQNEEITDINSGLDLKNSFNYMASNSRLVLPSYRLLRNKVESYDFSAFAKEEKSQIRLSGKITDQIDFIQDHLNRVRTSRRSHLSPGSESTHPSEINHHHFNLDAVKARHEGLKNWLQ